MHASVTLFERLFVICSNLIECDDRRLLYTFQVDFIELTKDKLLYIYLLLQAPAGHLNTHSLYMKETAVGVSRKNELKRLLFATTLPESSKLTQTGVCSVDATLYILTNE